MYMHFVSDSTILRSDFGIVLTMWHFFFFLILWTILLDRGKNTTKQKIFFFLYEYKFLLLFRILLVVKHFVEKGLLQNMSCFAIPLQPNTYLEKWLNLDKFWHVHLLKEIFTLQNNLIYIWKIIEKWYSSVFHNT